MKDLETEFVELTFTGIHWKSGKSKRSALKDLIGTKAQRALVRSRFQSAALMDAPSKFFFSLEKKNGPNRFIHEIKSAAGQELKKSQRRSTDEFEFELFIKNSAKVSTKGTRNCCMVFVEYYPGSWKTLQWSWRNHWVCRIYP